MQLIDLFRPPSTYTNNATVCRVYIDRFWNNFSQIDVWMQEIAVWTLIVADKSVNCWVILSFVNSFSVLIVLYFFPRAISRGLSSSFFKCHCFCQISRSTITSHLSITVIHDWHKHVISCCSPAYMATYLPILKSCSTADLAEQTYFGRWRSAGTSC